jgi:hypothetical protein
MSQFTVQLAVGVIPFKVNCGISVGWKIYFVHFVLQHDYVTLTLFQHLQPCAGTVFISIGISKLISFAVANMKTKLTNFELPTIV